MIFCHLYFLGTKPIALDNDIRKMCYHKFRFFWLNWAYLYLIILDVYVVPGIDIIYPIPACSKKARWRYSVRLSQTGCSMLLVRESRRIRMRPGDLRTRADDLREQEEYLVARGLLWEEPWHTVCSVWPGISRDWGVFNLPVIIFLTVFVPRWRWLRKCKNNAVVFWISRLTHVLAKSHVWRNLPK